MSYSSSADAESLSKITDSYGRVLSVGRDGNGVVTGLTDDQGRQWRYGLGGSYHNLDSYTNPDGKQTSYSYDTSHPADISDWLKQLTDGRGRVVKFGYSGATGDYQQVTSVTLVRDGTAANDVTWTFDYQPAGGSGHSCSDATNGRTVETDPRGKLTTYCHDNQGHVVQSFDALGRQQKRGYNAQANVTDVATTAGGTGNPLSLTYASDATHNLTGGTEPAGASFALSYCMTPGSSSNGYSGGVAGDLAQSSVRQYRDEQATKTDYDYNATGDLTSVRADASPAVAGLVLAYNSDGTIKSSTDGNGNVTNYAYTGHNLTSVTPPAASTLIGATTLTYDAQNRVKTVTDGLGTVATVSYDLEDRVTQVSYSNGRSFSVGYDANGNPTQRNERSGSTIVNTTTYGYDSLNRRISETFPGSQTNSYGYDKTSNLVSVTDGSGTSTYAYDDINRLGSVSSPKTGTADCASSPGSCDAVSFAYSDLAGSAATANGGATSRVTATYPGSLTQVTQANASGAPTSQAVKNPAGTVLQGFAYAYLTGGGGQQALISAITQQPSNNKTAYSYDVAKAQTSGALLSAITKNGSGSTVDSWSYGYDGAGNRTSRVHTVGSTTTTTSYAFNAANEMCWAFTGSSTAACASPPSGATSYAYDHAGNRTTGAAYDALSRATTMGSTTLSYLTPGNRELVGYGTTTFQNNLLGLDRELPSSTSAIAYTRAPDGTPLAQRTTATKQYLFSDQLGSVSALADDNATALTRTYAYDPDGNRTTTSTGSGTGATTNLGYAAGHLLPSGLYHYSARYYDPATARWTQQDPLNQYATPVAANRYSYVGGQPISLIDPSGEASIRQLAACGAIALAIACGDGDENSPSAQAEQAQALKDSFETVKRTGANVASGAADAAEDAAGGAEEIAEDAAGEVGL